MTAVIDQEITRANERGYYDENEIKELMDNISGAEIDSELSDACVKRVIDRQFIDGQIVVDMLLDFRNIVSPPVKEVNDDSSDDSTEAS